MQNEGDRLALARFGFERALEEVLLGEDLYKLKLLNAGTAGVPGCLDTGSFWLRSLPGPVPDSDGDAVA